MYSIILVDGRKAESLEQLGTKRKFWLRDGDRRVLFKAEERGTGEDWAEKIACELAALLGLPHVHYELAYDEAAETPGVVCDTCTPPPLALAHGNQLLLALDPEYPADESAKYKVRAHTVDAVADIVRALSLPPAAWSDRLPDGVQSALDVFAGYVMLDAWIANQDRHHQNWAAIWDGESLFLAPTFDHGASLARNLGDQERHERMTTRDQGRRLAPFARRARSAFYADAAESRPMTTVEAWQAFARLAPDGAAAWLGRLGELEAERVVTIVQDIPPDRMSKVCRDFTLQLLEENRTRLLSEDKGEGNP